jgi:hypothetical protein
VIRAIRLIGGAAAVIVTAAFSGACGSLSQRRAGTDKALARPFHSFKAERHRAPVGKRHTESRWSRTQTKPERHLKRTTTARKADERGRTGAIVISRGQVWAAPILALIGIARRPPRPSDRLPSHVEAILKMYPHEILGGRPIDVASARKLPNTPYRSWWVTNEKSAGCLVKEIPIRGGGGKGITTNCLPLSAVVEGWLVTTLADAPGEHGSVIEGIVPNGVRSVTVVGAGGYRRAIRVRWNTYVFSGQPSESVEYDLGARRYTVAIPRPPASMPAGSLQG